jgi:hypothetical protein
MTILCDCSFQQGAMAQNITDNFVHEVKLQQLRHFLNLHTCNLDNVDLFYQSHIKNALMQQPDDLLFHNPAVYTSKLISQKCNWIQKWTKAQCRTFAECFVAFTAAMLLTFDTVNICAIDAFEHNNVLPALSKACT